MTKRRLRMGMVGGGEGAFIGAIHRLAARMDDQIELVCGAFSSDAQRSKSFGETLFLNPLRCYSNYQEMFELESQLPADERMDFVAIVTPNHLHYPVAKCAIQTGFHVISDKPATLTLHEVLDLKKELEQGSHVYALTHTYTGYPMVKEARSRVANGELGSIKKIVVEYSQGWLASAEDEDSKQAAWRLDPERAGISCCIGDIGVHAANLAEYIGGSAIHEVCAFLESTVAGRALDDDGTVMLRFDNHAKGILISSQISVGEENNLRIRVYGDKASLDWSQQEPNSLKIAYPNKPSRLVRTGVGNLSEQATSHTRTPAGHPEGYLEAFANIYSDFAEQIRAQTQGPSKKPTYDTPNIDDAVRGMAFIETVVAASKSETKWHSIEDQLKTAKQ